MSISCAVTPGSTTRHDRSGPTITVEVVRYTALVATWTPSATSDRTCKSAAVLRGERGGPDDPGGVPQLGGDDLGAQVEQGQELLVVLAHTTSDDDQVGPEQVLDHGEVPLQPRTPRAPVEPVPVASTLGRTRLGVGPVDLQGAELGVGDEVPVDDQGRADAGAERHDQDDALHPPGRPL